MSRRIRVFKGILWFIVGLAAAATIDRFARGLSWTTRSDDFTSWTEITISFGIVSGFALVFFFVQEHFPVERESRARLGDTGFAVRRVYSLLFVVALSLGLTLTPWSPPVEATPVQRVGGEARLRAGHSVGEVSFPHDLHIEVLGQEACATCHHLNRPGEVGTPCSECHRDMYLSTRIFDHRFHAEVLNGRESCVECHAIGLPKAAATAKRCSECHEADMMAVIDGSSSEFDSLDAPPMLEAVHQVCFECHGEEAVDRAAGKQDLFNCAKCHRAPIGARQKIGETTRPE